METNEWNSMSVSSFISESSIWVLILIYDEAAYAAHPTANGFINFASFRGYCVVIGPAAVRRIQAGAFKVGDTAGTIDNIIHCKLHRLRSVGPVSKSF
ncbi:hypothetical protein CTI12_AA356500 [Artemisia annua]|uniref:Uncharacterized protein n=1 Tax=Artemisia annua TaxID=35608 RepID=A0A2U1MQL9_ARTAN|nr:hypothetical protein CTI12_AA356500 [Artemisia annua]